MQTHPTLSPALSPASASAASKPFLKWPGGKRRLLPQLLPLLPPGKRLIEPFVGAGSVFLATGYDHYVINDANSDLVAVWAALQVRPRDFIQQAQALFNEGNRNEQAYLRVRQEFNQSIDRFERAVRLPYLNRFCFNGVFRVNRRGDFNVPFGKPAKLPSLPIEEMVAAAEKLERCTIMNGGFAAAVEMAGVHDVLYCDPPYLDSSRGYSFTGYTTSPFGIAEHEQLLECCLQAASRGAQVLISNHDTPQVRALYRGWQIVEVSARRSVASNAEARGMAREIVALLPGSLS